MIGLLTESYCNDIRTENNLYKISNIKKIIQALIEESLFTLNAVTNLDSNFAFKEEKTDLLSTFKINYETEKLLNENGYKQTTIDKYNYENFNSVFSSENIKYHTKTNNFINNLNLNCKGIMKKVSWFLEENYIVFHEEGGTSTEYHFEASSNYILKDFKIDEDLFVYITYETNSKTFLMKSHLGFPFLTFNKNESEFDDKYFLMNVEIPNSFNKIISHEYNNFVLSNDKYDLKSVELGKLYYFEYDNKFYFNDIGSFESFEKYIIDKNVQVNNLNMYNYLNFLGLNEFKIKEDRKVSTFENDIFLNIFKNKFDNTTNGGLNYFNLVSEYGSEIDEHSLFNNIKKRPYQVNISDDIFNINGNFIYEYKDGEYTIEIDGNKCRLFTINGENKRFEKEITLNNLDSFIFCNLKFEKNIFGEIGKKLEYNFKVEGGYTYIQKTINHFSIEKLTDNEKAIKSSLENSTLIGVENRKTINEFDGNSIIFYNYFDYKNKEFKYSNKKINVLANQKVNLSNIKMFHCDDAYFVKDNFIYFRKNSEFIYTEFDKFKFDLINEKKYITNFWIENQNKEVFFKNKDNGIEITENYNDCDYSVKIPEIKKYFIEDNKLFDSVSIDDNDELESEENYSENILITDKFLSEPLFYKSVIDTNEKIDIFDEKGNQIFNVIYELDDEKTICYMNPEKNKLYYCNYANGEMNYLSFVKSFDNNVDKYMFDSNSKIEFGIPKKIKTFMIDSDKNISENEIINIVLYNKTKGEVNKIEMSGSEIKTIFDLDLTVDSIFIEKPTGYENVNFSFSEVKVKSIKTRDKILFIKDKREDVVFYSKEKKNNNLETIDLTKVKVQTKYTIEKDRVTESYKGNLIIGTPSENEIPIMYKNNFTAIENTVDIVCAIQKNDFYKENFKGLGITFKDDLGTFKKITETFNESLTTEEIIEK